MRIQHNIAALNSYRQLSGNNSAVAKNLEKLSSGYRINRAGDDAAGLAISEKMRAQITGLETAQKNANDGISLVQTAEGALTEVHSMLNRMVELANQSANGTYDDKTDRANLQKELDSLLDEVDRISDATNFNGINLLDGSLGGAKVTTTVGTAASTATPVTPSATGTAKYTNSDKGGATRQAKLTVDFKDMTIAATNDGTTGATMQFTIGGSQVEIKVGDKELKDADIAERIAEKLNADGLGGEAVTAIVTGTTSVSLTVTAQKEMAAFDGLNGTNVAAPTGAVGTPTNGTASTAVLDFDGRAGGDFLGGTVKIGDKAYSFVKDATKAAAGTTAVVIQKDSTSDKVAEALANAATADGATLNGTKVTFTEQADAGKYSGKEIKVKFEGTALRLQVGDTDDDFQKVGVSVGDMSAKGLGLAALKNVGIADQTTAGISIDKIKTAINSVSSTRGDLGAIQNRLEHTINNLSVTTENMTAAENRIRDTDMAEEMMAYTKNNILVQASQAMLAQANQVPQGVLQLLQ